MLKSKTIGRSLLYTIPLALILLSLAVQSQSTGIKMLEGKINGAPYRIHIPEVWNKSLIMYAHGYGRNTVGNVSRFGGDLLCKQGYAVAYSGYADSGWAVESAIKDMEALRARAIIECGTPDHVYISGHSMGGCITVSLMELYPDHYDGGVSFCGAVDSSLRLWRDNIFRLRVLYDAYFPGLPGDAVTFPDGFTFKKTFLPHFNESAKDKEKMKKLLVAAKLPNANALKRLMYFSTGGIKDMIEHAGGNPFDTTDIDYGKDINDKVKRYKADAVALEYMKKYRMPTGKLKKPLLAVHNRNDNLVPLWTEMEYRERVKKAGCADNHSLRVIERRGHCAFSPQETLAAFADLIRWCEHDEKPLDRL
jgi:pimeloyl-ACP methyl ester carboxylesterase